MARAVSLWRIPRGPDEIGSKLNTVKRVGVNILTLFHALLPAEAVGSAELFLPEPVPGT